MTAKNKKIIIICTSTAAVLCAAAVLLIIFVFGAKTPYAMLHSTSSSDIDSISLNHTVIEQKAVKLTGDDADKFLDMLKNAEYKSVSYDTAHAPVDGGYPITATFSFKDGERQQLVLIGGYGDGNGTKHTGFIDFDGKCFECDISAMSKFYYERANA